MDDLGLPLVVIMFFVGILIFGTIKDNNNTKKVELLIKDAGSISNYLYNLGYATKAYEKINDYDVNLHSISFEDIASYYVSRGYDVRWIKTGRYEGHYEAVKLVTN